MMLRFTIIVSRSHNISISTLLYNHSGTVELDIKNSLIVSGCYCHINYAVADIQLTGCGPYGRTHTPAAIKGRHMLRLTDREKA